jgi:hypothetical protein
LSPLERAALGRALVVVPLVRLALLLLPFRVVHRAVCGRPRPASPAPALMPIEPAVWAVRAVAGRVPGASCLTQALAAALLLRRYGHEATLRVGVARVDGGLRAHAWVESGGRTVIGEPAAGTFQVLPTPAS